MPDLFSCCCSPQLHQILNPLSGVKVEGPVVVPLWAENTKFDMVCFLSTKPKLSQM
jgi:hypothetical protein